MKKNVLVFPCGSEIGLEINRALAGSLHFDVYGANSVDDHGKFVYKNYIEELLSMDDFNFVDEINQIISDYQIDFIIPAHDSAVTRLADEQHRINAVVVTSDAETCRVCRSKGETYKLFDGLIPTPALYEIDNLNEFPVFLKPDVGQGTKGTYRVDTMEDAQFYFKNDPTLLALEFLPGKEYTIDCFTNKEGELLFAEGRVRNRILNGISVNSTHVRNRQFQRLAEVINKTLKFRGVWFFQVKERSDGEMVLMEISPRIAGTMALFRASGVNFALLSLFDRMGHAVSVLKNDIDVEVDRALFSRFTIAIEYEYVYVDFDDTIVFENCVNIGLIRFLYQARNQDKKIILITKHIHNIQETLNKYAISPLLFQETICLPKTARKTDYMVHKNAIFIDDSFEERKEVMDVHGIPSFGLDAVEALLCWRA